MKLSTLTSECVEADLNTLGTRAYGVVDWVESTLRLYHDLRPSLVTNDASLMARLHAWLLVPITLWPFDMIGLFHGCLLRLQSGAGLEDDVKLVIELLPEVPCAEVCEAVAEHEHQVQKGNYEDMIHAQAKFTQAELALSADPEFQRDWRRLKDQFDVSAFQDYKGLMRRTMTAERNLRPGYKVDLANAGETFRLAFDAFCLRWHLYGMQHDQPLLLKLAVNLTAHGTMILIPSFWSFDAKRDLRWDAINQLHRVRVPGRQGAALAEGLAERMALAVKLKELDAQAKTQKLKGDKKHLFLCAGLGLAAETSPKRLARLRKEFAPK